MGILGSQVERAGVIDLSGKVAIVTGASRKIGIGAATARALAQAGASLFITYYRPYDSTMEWGSVPTEVDELLAEIRALGPRAEGLELDLTDIGAPRRLFDAAIEAFGAVDMLVNNAAYSVDCDIDHLDAEIIDQHYAVNVRGIMLLCAEFVRRWRKPAGGRIINLSSGQSYLPMPGNLPYAATKGAVEAFTFTLAAEVASRGITVNAVDPGGTDTGWMPADLKADLQKNAPMGRIGQPEDAARLIRFLASDEAEWITGQIIRSRGGM